MTNPFLIQNPLQAVRPAIGLPAQRKTEALPELIRLKPEKETK